MPKGKKRNKKKHNRRAAVNKAMSYDKMLLKVQSLMERSGITEISTCKQNTGYIFDFTPNKDYSGNEAVKLIREILSAHMSRNGLEGMEISTNI